MRLQLLPPHAMRVALQDSLRLRIHAYPWCSYIGSYNATSTLRTKASRMLTRGSGQMHAWAADDSWYKPLHGSSPAV